jgi:hypothetical protein
VGVRPCPVCRTSCPTSTWRLRTVGPWYTPGVSSISMLPIYNRLSTLCRGWGLNPRPQAYESCALPTELRAATRIVIKKILIRRCPWRIRISQSNVHGFFFLEDYSVGPRSPSDGGGAERTSRHRRSERRGSARVLPQTGRPTRWTLTVC